MIGGPRPEPAAPEYGETEIAERFARDYASRVRYIESRKAWVYWDGKRWNSDETQYVKDLVRQHCRSESALAAITPKVTEAQARSIASEKCINAVFRLVGVDQNVASFATDWDANPWLLGVPDGIVDLKTGTLRAATPDDMVTKSAAVTPAGDCPLWLAFVNRATDGDAAMQAYLQRIAGYCLTADTSEQALFFFDGPGGNGKGVFLNTLQGIFRDYAKPTAIETLTASHGDRHPTEIADLLGARMVICTETERGKRWAESRIKQLTGGDKVSARFMGRDFFTFVPTFKLAISGNSKPSLRADAAMRRRFQVIPFRVTIPKEERDKDLSEKLKREWPGILAWAIAGCMAWQRDGLNPPASVVGATTAYMDEQADDTLAVWIADCWDTSDPVARTPMSKLHASYKAYALNAGEKDIMSAIKLGLALTELGYKAVRTGSEGRQRIGIKEKVTAPCSVARLPSLPPFPRKRDGFSDGVTG
jgi:putative DNA primase/helicase